MQFKQDAPRIFATPAGSAGQMTGVHHSEDAATAIQLRGGNFWEEKYLRRFWQSAREVRRRACLRQSDAAAMPDAP